MAKRYCGNVVFDITYLDTEHHRIRVSVGGKHKDTFYYRETMPRTKAGDSPEKYDEIGFSAAQSVVHDGDSDLVGELHLNRNGVPVVSRTQNGSPISHTGSARSAGGRRLVNSFIGTGDLGEGGLLIYRTQYGHEADFVVPAHDNVWRIYRFPVDRRERGSSEWYDRKLTEVAATTDYGGPDLTAKRGAEILLEDLHSGNLKARSMAWSAILSYFGAREFDQEPLEIYGVAKLKKRYPRMVLGSNYKD